LKYLYLFLLIISSLAGFAQSPPGAGSIKGLVLDGLSEKPVDYASISVFADTGSLPLNGAVTNENGQFIISGLKPGTYHLITDFINYQRDTSKRIVVTTTQVEIGKILLKSSRNHLQGVTIAASAPIVENKLDRIVYNAANDLSSQGSTALEMLRKVPQVTVDLDGNVELQGNSNIRFLINGKPSSVFGNSLADALSAIPASQIQRIEAITIPGAKYDAQGTGGIINIILKESKIHGYNGSLNLSAGTRLENSSLNVAVRQGSIGFNGYLSGNALRTTNTPSRQDRTSMDLVSGSTSELIQNGGTYFDRSGYQAGIGMDWDLSHKDNWNAGLSINHFGNHGSSYVSRDIITHDSSGRNMASSSNTGMTDSRYQNHSLDWNLSYKHSFSKEGQELSIQYHSSLDPSETNFRQTQTDAGITAPNSGTSTDNQVFDHASEISIDYSQPVNERVSWESGMKLSLEHINSQSDVSNLQTGGSDFVYNPTQSYTMDYKSQVYAAYVTASFPFFHILDIKAGLRYEYNAIQLAFPGAQVPENQFLAPTIILSHKFEHSQTLKLAYTRRIERAEVWTLNPFVDRSDPYNLSTGNPALLPEIGNNLELGYSRNFEKGNVLNVSLIERINTQDHKRVVDYYSSYQVGDSILQNVSVATFKNAGVEINTGLNISGTINIREKLKLRTNFMLYQQAVYPNIPELQDVSGVIGWRFRTNVNLSYQFPRNLMGEVFGNYASATNNIQGRSPQWFTYNLAFRKQFLDKKLSIGLTCNNPFNQYIKQVTTINTLQYSSYAERNINLRSFGISINWKFGKLAFSKERDELPEMGNGQAG